MFNDSIRDFISAFGLEHPVVQGPMGGVAGPRLVAAMCNAGGLGILPIWPEPLEVARAAIRQTRELTPRGFAVNLRADLQQHDHIRLALDEGVALIHLFWGDPAPSMPAIRAAGARMLATVSDADTTRRALDAGACALIAQGFEAGGHVLSEIPLDDLLPLVLDLAGDVPVIAAGGISNGEDARRLAAAGASGVVLGTRLVVCEESDAHPAYKQALMNAGDNDTARSLCFDGLWPDAPHRTLANSTFRAWQAAGLPAPGRRPGEGDVILKRDAGPDVLRYSAEPPVAGMLGEIEAAALYAGTGVGRVANCPAAAQVVAEISAALSGV